MTEEQVKSKIAAQFQGAQIGGSNPLDVTIPVTDWAAFARFAKETLGFRFFAFLTAIDWKDQGLEVVVRLDNLDHSLGLTVKTRLGAGVSDCPSLVPVYRGADWMERECFEMFGIRFAGHPDLRRLLLPDDWQGFPLLKSYAVDTPYPPYR